MPDLLLELLSEEIPARMQAKAADDLKRLITNGLVEAGLVYEGAVAYATPRRLALHVAGIPARSPDTREERKGPRVGAPEQAIQGFLKSAGLISLDQAKVQSDGKKGEFYVAVIEKPGRPAIKVLAELIPAVVRDFPWPKSMRWGSRSTPPGTPWSGLEAKGSASLRWVRPLHSILATFGPETEEPEIVPCVIDGIRAADRTRGHRFHAGGPIAVRHFDDYVAKLDRAFVVLDPERRKRAILADANNLAIAQGLELIEDPGLLDEVAGLVEWPVVLMGAFDPDFLAVPAEVIRATIRANQKCFVLREADGRLSNRFILVANIEASDGGDAIIAGNERVVRARLSDAKYFWETDQRALPDVETYAEAAERLGLNLTKPLDQRMAKLAHMNVVFHEKLGTQGERVQRIVALAREIAPLVEADPEQAARAALLAKADLVSEVVGEFPETQGLMGRYYAALQGEADEVANAIEEHYKPLGPSDRVPTSPVSIAVALADKLDMLVGFWAVDEKPTGSKDPYALRRAALGVIRLVLENKVRLGLGTAIDFAAFAKRYSEVLRYSQSFGDRFTIVGIAHDGQQQEAQSGVETLSEAAAAVIRLVDDDLYLFDETVTWGVDTSGRGVPIRPPQEAQFKVDAFRQAPDLLAFFHDRLKVQLREQGARHDLVDAVLSGAGGGANDDLLLIVKRVEALGRFLETADGAALLAAYRRAANIIRIEEKKDGVSYEGAVDAALLEARGLGEEKVLAHVLDAAVNHAHEHVLKEDFEGAMAALAELRPAVDAFFDKILVNDPDADLRRNRLNLLARFRAATREVADFARIEG